MPAAKWIKKIMPGVIAGSPTAAGACVVKRQAPGVTDTLHGEVIGVIQSALCSVLRTTAANVHGSRSPVISTR
jgi:hypothetical protein